MSASGSVTPPAVASRGGWFALIIIGSILALIAGGMLGAAAVASAVVARSEGGVLATHPLRVSTDGVAVTTPAAEIETSLDPESFPEVRVTLMAEPVGGDAVFLGIGPSAEVAAYLDGAHVGEVTGVQGRPLELRIRDIPGSAQPGEPAAQPFWVASDSGTGDRELSWTVRPGDWTVVIMNADASAGVDASIRPGVDVPWAVPLATGFLVAVAVLLLIGLALMIVGVAGWGRGRPLTTSPTGAPYPAVLVGELRETPSRALWLVKWILVIPHAIVLGLLSVPFLVTTIVAGFAILFTGRYPRALFAFNVGFLRWAWRVSFYAYSALATDQYPPFSLQRTDYPADFDVVYPERLSHGLVLVKSWLLAIPHLLVVGILTGSVTWGFGWMRDIVGSAGDGISLLGLLVLVAAVALLFTGRYLPALFDLVVGVNRWAFRVAAYVALMRDEYPPFRLDQGAHEPVLAPGTAPATESKG